ncbi:fimbrial protein [Paraburkholderia sp. BL21I4N1]|uniref:fimbrial protein n=1 Tax=Paraburkholderia sp. BL21I4N1 TaxID=1938801 RepID=UPI000CFB1D85|nr:fimbrial protein [Paraburkholderia sp. BL21I4N1]PQV45549.1 type 1 fimbria pilin [Paraburkholderia sp. BL21I4N1]
MRHPINTTRAAVRVILLVVFTLCWTANARADCPTTGLPKTFTYGTLAISNSLVAGDTIPGTVQSFTLSGQCTNSATFDIPVVVCASGQTPVSGMPGVFTTGLPGVGMRMRNGQGVALNQSGACGADSSLGSTSSNGSFNVSGTLELVKTGTVTGGTIASAQFVSGVLNTGIQLNNGSNRLTVTTGAIRPVTCSVTADTAAQTVALRPVSASAFPSAGSTAANTPFSIGLTCQTGVSVAVTFSSTSSSGMPNVIASNGTATGIGVQLLNASRSAIALDSPLQLTSGTTGNTSFQFFAQYYRLGAASVTPGTVNATAIFTMTYQ